MGTLVNYELKKILTINEIVQTIYKSVIFYLLMNLL